MRNTADHIGRVCPGQPTRPDIRPAQANRSLVGSMNDLAYLAEFHKAAGEAEDLVPLSASLAETPCSPLYKRHTSPDREVRALVAEWSAQ